MKHFNLKITSTGSLCGANPSAKPGYPIYRIEGVPDDVPLSAVMLKLSKIILAHAIDDDDAWVYQWPEIVALPDGAIINRYTRG